MLRFENSVFLSTYSSPALSSSNCPRTLRASCAVRLSSRIVPHVVPGYGVAAGVGPAGRQRILRVFDDFLCTPQRKTSRSALDVRKVRRQCFFAFSKARDLLGWAAHDHACSNFVRTNAGSRRVPLLLVLHQKPHVQPSNFLFWLRVSSFS